MVSTAVKRQSFVVNERSSLNIMTATNVCRFIFPDDQSLGLNSSSFILGYIACYSISLLVQRTSKRNRGALKSIFSCHNKQTIVLRSVYQGHHRT